MYAPWYCATSSPITKTSLSRVISSLMAEFRASRTVICARGGAGGSGFLVRTCRRALAGRVRAWTGGAWTLGAPPSAPCRARARAGASAASPAIWSSCATFFSDPVDVVATQAPMRVIAGRGLSTHPSNQNSAASLLRSMEQEAPIPPNGRTESNVDGTSGLCCSLGRVTLPSLFSPLPSLPPRVGRTRARELDDHTHADTRVGRHPRS